MLIFLVITFLLAYYRLIVEGKTEENMEEKEKSRGRVTRGNPLKLTPNASVALGEMQI